MKDISDLHFDIFDLHVICFLVSKPSTFYQVEKGDGGGMEWTCTHAEGLFVAFFHVQGQQRTGRVSQPSDASLFNLRVPAF